MRDKESLGLPVEQTDWSSAWEAVSRLAATRESLRADHSHDPSLTSEPKPADPPETASDIASTANVIALDREQLAGAVAEIENASAVLRRSEPALELGFPSASAQTEGHGYWSLWVLIAAIWMSATLVVASATGAILYLFG